MKDAELVYVFFPISKEYHIYAGEDSHVIIKSHENGISVGYIQNIYNKYDNREDISFSRDGKIEEFNTTKYANDGYCGTRGIASFLRKNLDFFVEKFKEQKPEQYERVLHDLELLLEKLK